MNVLTAANGVEALQIIECQRIDLLVTDYRMPLMDGIELATIVKRKHPTVAVVMVSCFSYPELRQSVLALGVHQCIEKDALGLEDLALTLLKSAEHHYNVVVGSDKKTRRKRIGEWK